MLPLLRGIGRLAVGNKTNVGSGQTRFCLYRRFATVQTTKVRLADGAMAPADKEDDQNTQGGAADYTAEKNPFIITHTIPAQDIPFHDPESTFQSLGIDESIVKSLSQKKIGKPSRIQAKAIPEILSKKTCMIGAETGSGKTLAYLIPIAHTWLADTNNSSASKEQADSQTHTTINAVAERPIEDQVAEILSLPKSKVREWKQPENPYALILTPRKELCSQIARVARELHPKFASSVFAVDDGKQFDFPPNSISILTPGTMKSSLQFLNPKKRSDFTWLYSTLKYVVFDEIDMLLDEGFREQIETIIKQIRKINLDAQFMFVGATIPKSGPKSAHQFIAKKFPEMQSIESDFLHSPVPTLTQHFVKIPFKSTQPIDSIPAYELVRRKKTIVSHIFQKIFTNEKDEAKVLIFANTKSSAERAFKLISSITFKPTLILHSGLGGSKQTLILDRFRQSSSVLLVCTDVAGRGIDFDDVTHIIQFDFALSAIQYLHRVGRAGRAGKQGEVYNILAPSDELLAKKIMTAKSNFLRLFSRGRSLSRNYKRGQKEKRLLQEQANALKNEEDESSQDSDNETQTSKEKQDD